MQTYDPPHKANDDVKLAAMVEQIVAGNDLPPVVVIGDKALTGSHRIEAYRRANRDERLTRELCIPVVEASESDLRRALVVCGASAIEQTEHNVLCHALMSVTDDEDVRRALVDQTHGDTARRSEIERVRAMTDEEVAEEFETL